MQLLSDHTKTLPPLKVSDVVSIQNKHWPQPALLPEQTPLIDWGTPARPANNGAAWQPSCKKIFKLAEIILKSKKDSGKSGPNANLKYSP